LARRKDPRFHSSPNLSRADLQGYQQTVFNDSYLDDLKALVGQPVAERRLHFERLGM